jgi:hypothetical protein
MSSEPLDPIDRLASEYQEARLRKRRFHRCAALAVQAGDVPATRRALAHLRTAASGETRAYRRYVRAVFDAYCPSEATYAAPSMQRSPVPDDAGASGNGR